MDFFHGTSTALLREIKRVGLKAPVYLGSEPIADYYAEEAVESHGGKPVVLRISPEALNPDRLTPDHNGIEEPLTYTLGMSEDEVWEEWDDSDGTWEVSWEIIESVKYTERIPPTAIEVE